MTWPVLVLLAAIPISTLPRRWRRRIHAGSPPWVAATVTSAIIQGMATLVLGSVLYVHFLESQAAFEGLRTLVFTGQEQGVTIDEGHMLGFGLTCFIGFILSPGGLLVLFLWGETLFRVIGAVVSNNAVGMTVFWLLERASAAVQRLWDDLRRRRAVVDVVRQPTSEELCIASCRPRDWDPWVTLEYEGQHYSLVSHGRSPDTARPFVYWFGPTPSWAIFRKLVRYSPHDILYS